MSKTLGKNVLRTSAFTLACLALVGADVKAAAATSTSMSTTATTPLESYSTTGANIGYTTAHTTDTSGNPILTPGSAGISNTIGGANSPIGFNQVTSGMVGLNSNVSLGSFAVSTLNDGSTTTYTNTPFTIYYNPLSINGGSYLAKPIMITGELNGWVNGNSSQVTATFNPIQGSVFQSPDSQYLTSISVPSQELLVPSTSNNGITSIQASIVTSSAVQPPPLGGSQTTPEPTTLAILATSIVGFGLRRRLRSRSGRQSA